MPVLHLNEEEVRELLDMDMAIEAVETGLRKMALEEAFNNPRSRCQTDHAMLHVLPAACKTMGVIGYKAYVTTKSRQTFHVMIFHGKTGELLAMIQGDLLGRLRTGAASAVATKHLARPEASVVAILGSGRQAATQLSGVSRVRKLTEARVFSPNEANRLKFAAELAAECQIPVRGVSSVEECVRGADIICTATTAREPILKGEWLSPGQHLNIAGSNFLAKTEIDTEVVKRCSLVTIDSKDQGKLEAGDLVPALDAGILEWFDVVEIGRVVANRNQGRTSPNDITMFKSLGIGLEDIAVGIRLYEKAIKAGKGRMLDL